MPLLLYSESSIMKKMIITSLVILLMFGCTSRLRTTLLLVSDSETNHKLTIDQTHFYPESILGDGLSDTKVIPGNRNVGVLTISTRWLMIDKAEEDFVLNEKWKAHLYLQFPAEIQSADTVGLQLNSFVNVREYYQLPVGQKLFEPQSGYFVIDSILKREMYVSVNGSFKNSNDISFGIAGKFKLKYAD